MAHNIHMILVRADSAAKASEYVLAELKGWGTENNYHFVCIVLSEDGTDDDLEYPHEDGKDDDLDDPYEGWAERWGLGFLNVPVEAGTTLFGKALQNVRDRIWGPIFFQIGASKFIEFGDERAAVAHITNQMTRFDPAASEAFELVRVSGHCRHLYEILASREQIRRNPDRFQYYPGKYTESGLSDWTIGCAGRQTYLVFIDMHS